MPKLQGAKERTKIRIVDVGEKRAICASIALPELLEDNAMMPEGKRQTLYINEVMVDSQHYATDRAVEAQFRILTGYSPEEFDGDLVERLSGGRLTASAHR
jgi:hypothetical protein